MRRIAPVLVALLLVGASCTASEVDPDARVRVSARVVDAGGAPVPGAEAALRALPDAAEVVFGATFAIGSLGLVCLLDDIEPRVCADGARATSAPDGTVAFDLEGRDTQGTLGQASELDLTVVVGEGDARRVTSVRFRAQQEAVDLGPVAVWDGTTTTATSADGVVVDWSELPAALGGDPSWTVRASDDDGLLLWSVPDAARGAAFDARLLEDRTASVQVGGTVERQGPGTTVRPTYFAAAATATGPGAPPSRGLACVATVDGVDQVLDPCPLTDGVLAVDPARSTPGAATALVVDRGAVAPTSLVVLRGATGVVSVEVSADGTTWTPVLQAGGSPLAATPSLDSRWVRLRRADDGPLGPVAELAVW